MKRSVPLTSKLRNEMIFILAGGGLLVALIAANVQGLPSPLAILRLALVLVYILFVPGYVLQRAVYRIQVKAGDQVLSQAGRVDLENGKTWQNALEFKPLTAGDDQQILLIMDREGQPSPYRTLPCGYGSM